MNQVTHQTYAHLLAAVENNLGSLPKVADLLRPIQGLHAKCSLGPYLLPLMRYARVIAILMKANYRTLELGDRLFLQAWVRNSGRIQAVFAHFSLRCLICLGTENLEQSLDFCPANKCVSTYHQACLNRFLQVNPSCPNCRGGGSNAAEAPVNQTSPFNTEGPFFNRVPPLFPTPPDSPLRNSTGFMGDSRNQPPGTWFF